MTLSTPMVSKSLETSAAEIGTLGAVFLSFKLFNFLRLYLSAISVVGDNDVNLSGRGSSHAGD
jgi:hypothetical protein